MAYFIQVYGEQRADGSYFLPSSTNSLITSILSAGTFVGALSGSLVGDRIGRRWGIIFYIGQLKQRRHKAVLIPSLVFHRSRSSDRMPEPGRFRDRSSLRRSRGRGCFMSCPDLPGRMRT